MCGPSITNFFMSRKYAQNGLEGLFNINLAIILAAIRNCSTSYTAKIYTRFQNYATKPKIVFVANVSFMSGELL